ncbi:MAG TPA: hypothetical protein VEV43_15005 [Actinomycetota bacterium]|nr:hypothetical protein [Actinomycetota bacterium]
MKKKLAGVVAAAVTLIGAAVAPSANAQTASAAVAIVFANVDGTSVSCSLPTSTGVHLRSCSLTATAAGATVPTNFCEETASVSVLPGHASAGRLGCGVTVRALLTTEITTAEAEEGESYVHSCTGAGIGTATYSPAPTSAAVPISGPVAVTWIGGVVTIEGALVNVGQASAGQISAEGFDLCGSELDPNPFAGRIN